VKAAWHQTIEQLAGEMFAHATIAFMIREPNNAPHAITLGFILFR